MEVRTKLIGGRQKSRRESFGHLLGGGLHGCFCLLTRLGDSRGRYFGEEAFASDSALGSYGIQPASVR
jgi:hypothetical protein